MSSTSEDVGTGLKPWEPERLSPRHKNILALIASGMKNREISRMEGMPDESRISVIKNSPAGKAYLQRLSAEMVQGITENTQELIASHSREAVQTVVQLMRAAASENVRLSASKDLLDRGGHKPVERQEHVHVEVDGEDVDRLVAAMNEAKRETPEFHEYEESHKLFPDENEIVIADE